MGASRGLIVLRHPDQRHLGDLIAGTQVVRVVPCEPLGRLDKRKGLAAFALDALWICCLFVGPWIGSQLWLHSLRHQHKA